MSIRSFLREFRTFVVSSLPSTPRSLSVLHTSIFQRDLSYPHNHRCRPSSAQGLRKASRCKKGNYCHGQHRRLEWIGHTGAINCASYSPDGCHVVTGSSDRTIRIWDAETGAVVGEPLEGHTESVQSVAYSPDGRHIVSGSLDKTIRIWDAETGAAIGKPLEGHTGSVQSVVYSPDGRHHLRIF
jgi:WD40 repeat protein